MGFNNKRIIIDGRAHLMGRLAAVVARKLLQGDRCVVVRCERLNISGSLYRNKLKYMAFLRKKCNVNPARGPFHLRSPRMIFWRTVRGMLPHKTKRGARALERLHVHDGIPPPFDIKKRAVIPTALRDVRLVPMRKYCDLGQLASRVGWRYRKIVALLEAKRKVRAKHNFKRALQKREIKEKALRLVSKKIAPIQKIIESYGHR